MFREFSELVKMDDNEEKAKKMEQFFAKLNSTKIDTIRSTGLTRFSREFTLKSNRTRQPSTG